MLLKLPPPPLSIVCRVDRARLQFVASFAKEQVATGQKQGSSDGSTKMDVGLLCSVRTWVVQGLVARGLLGGDGDMNGGEGGCSTRRLFTSMKLVSPKYCGHRGARLAVGSLRRMLEENSVSQSGR